MSKRLVSISKSGLTSQERYLLGEPDVIRIVNGQETKFYAVERIQAIKDERKVAEANRRLDQIRQGLEQYQRVVSGELITRDQVKAEYNLFRRDLRDVLKTEVYHPDKEKFVTYYERDHAKALAKALQGKGLILKTHAMREYGLSRRQIEQLSPLVERINQNYRSGPTMKLYSRDEIEQWLVDNRQQ